MWIQMKTTYSGSIGMFVANQQYDLPADIVEHLPDDSYETITPPWEADADPKAKAAYENAKAGQRLDAITAEVRALNARADELTKAAQAATEAADEAKNKWYSLRDEVEKKHRAAARAEEKAKAAAEAVDRKQTKKSKKKAQAEADKTFEKYKEAQAAFEDTEMAEYQAGYDWREAHINAHRKALEAKDTEQQAQLKKLELDRAKGRSPQEQEKQSETPKDKQARPAKTK